MDYLLRKELNSDELPNQTSTQNDTMVLTNSEELDNVARQDDESKMVD